MSFVYHLRFLFLQSIIKSRKRTRSYAKAKISNEQAKDALLKTVGPSYHGDEYFEMVDRTYTSIKDGIIPVYDVQLCLTKDKSLHQLLDFYSRLRERDVRSKWYVSLYGGHRDLDVSAVVIPEDIRQHADAMLAKVGRPAISWTHTSTPPTHEPTTSHMDTPMPWNEDNQPLIVPPPSREPNTPVPRLLPAPASEMGTGPRTKIPITSRIKVIGPRRPADHPISNSKGQVEEIVSPEAVNKLTGS